MQNDPTRLAEFFSSVIEEYKVLHHLSGADAANLLNRSGALDFLEDGYEMLHTQSLAYIVDEVEGYMKKRGAVK
ncbi:MAG: DUF3791 domain-containing protein [Clostridia bacterium]